MTAHQIAYAVVAGFFVLAFVAVRVQIRRDERWLNRQAAADRETQAVRGERERRRQLVRAVRAEMIRHRWYASVRLVPYEPEVSDLLAVAEYYDAADEEPDPADLG